MNAGLALWQGGLRYSSSRCFVLLAAVSDCLSSGGRSEAGGEQASGPEPRWVLLVAPCPAPALPSAVLHRGLTDSVLPVQMCSLGLPGGRTDRAVGFPPSGHSLLAESLRGRCCGVCCQHCGLQLLPAAAFPSPCSALKQLQDEPAAPSAAESSSLHGARHTGTYERQPWPRPGKAASEHCCLVLGEGRTRLKGAGVRGRTWQRAAAQFAGRAKQGWAAAFIGHTG